MMDLLQLAERCEAATGPDRELDALINDIAGRHPTMPQYTASVDAALTLVPKGYWSSCDFRPDGAGIATCNNNYGIDSGACGGATPALAICAAALRARASEQNNG